MQIVFINVHAHFFSLDVRAIKTALFCVVTSKDYNCIAVLRALLIFIVADITLIYDQYSS